MRFLHICFPFSGQFVAQVVEYAGRGWWRAEHVVIHSTVMPGTTSSIASEISGHALYSPVRGRHGKMTEDLRYFTKYVAGFNPEAAGAAAGALAAVGFRVQVAPDVKALELAKLLQTSFTGLLVAWAQEAQRFCDELGVDYEEACELFGEMPNLPPVLHMPGFIGGHCVMSNIDLLERVHLSPLLSAVVLSNNTWVMERGRDDERVWPKPWRQHV